MLTNETMDISTTILTNEICNSLSTDGEYYKSDMRTCQLLASNGYRVVLPVLGIILGISCVTLNSLVGAFFSSKTDQVMHLIYFLLACSDMITGVVAIYQGTAVILTEWFFPAARLHFYSIFYVVGQLPLHVSAFINVLLTVARTTSIFFPVHIIRREYIKLGILIYTVIWFILIVAEWVIAHNIAGYLQADWTAVVGILYVYPRPGACIVEESFWQIAGKVMYNDLETCRRILVILVTVFIPYGLPSIICLISAVMQVRQIFINTSTQTREKSQRRNKKMSVTIILLTGVFFICNTAFLMAMIIDMEIELDNSEHYKRGFVLLLASNHLLYLNSALTPLILILRGSTMKEFVMRRFSVRKTSGSAHSKSSMSNSFNNNNLPGTKV